MINLAGIAEPGIGPVTGRGWGSVDALAAVRNRTHIPVADPPPDRTGSGDLESVAWYLAMAGFWAAARASERAVRFPLGISNA
jgi:hypothetical protein